MVRPYEERVTKVEDNRSQIRLQGLVPDTTRVFFGFLVFLKHLGLTRVMSQIDLENQKCERGHVAKPTCTYNHILTKHKISLFGRLIGFFKFKKYTISFFPCDKFPNFLFRLIVAKTYIIDQQNYWEERILDNKEFCFAMK